MAGHSKWANIKHKKGAADAARGKIFTKHAKLITLAAKDGGDIDMNPKLRNAIASAKKENVPNSNIEKAIKKGTGELKDGTTIEEVWYEGYGPNGIAIMAQTLTDNRNRSLTNVRTCFNRNGGSLGETGSVSYMFKRKGEIIIETNNLSVDEIEMMALEAEGEDIEYGEKEISVYCDNSSLEEVANALKEQGAIITEQKNTFIADMHVEVTDSITAKKLFKILDALDDDDDVTNVYSNFTGDLESLLEE